MVLLIVFGLILLVLSLYGMHRYWMVWQTLLHRRAESELRAVDGAIGAERSEESLPRVTVQLPMFNERHVAERIIDAACALDYPRERLQIQVLDDSTDESGAIARRCCERHAAAGVDIAWVHRSERSGYKAGALGSAMASATGEFVAIFDADFVPSSDFLRRAMVSFSESDVGLVQARWGHLNREQSWMTRIQAMFLDAHFGVEQYSRARSGRWFNFNGTAGVWRRQAIEEAGGWQPDTLTEDTDLSYRAQRLGWRFVFRPDIVCDAELPPSMHALLSQQHRWSKGLIQVARKLLPSTLEDRGVSVETKAEVWFHLTSPLMYPLVLMMTLLAPLAIFLLPQEPSIAATVARVIGFGCLLLGTTGAAAYLVAGQLVSGRRLLPALVDVPLALAVGVGISVVNTKAVCEALVGHRSGFVRTPKFNRGSASTIDPGLRVRGRFGGWLPRGVAECVLAMLMFECVVMNFAMRETLISVPFLLLFAAGYGVVSWQAIRESLFQARGSGDGMEQRLPGVVGGSELESGGG